MTREQARRPKPVTRRDTPGTSVGTKEQPPCRLPRTIPDELADTVADRLKRSLRYANLHQYDMADYLELHRNSVGDYVRGKTKMLPAVMRIWADRTGVPLSWLKTGQWPDEDV